MSDFKVEIRDASNETIARTLRESADRFAPKKRLSRGFWVGVLVGAIVIAAMDYSDIHLCVGSCDTSSAWGSR